MKRYPVCSAAQALIEQTALLCRAIDADSIESIECHVPTLVDVSLMHDEPLTVQEAQFSLPYAVACAARGGALDLDDLTTESLADPAMRALMRRVRKIVDAGLSSDAMRMAAPAYWRPESAASIPCRPPEIAGTGCIWTSATPAARR